MKKRTLWVLTVFLLVGGSASATDRVPLTEMTGPWLALLKSGEPAVRTAASAQLVEIVRNHPAAARDVVRHMADERNNGIASEHEKRLVPLAKESPATVSALIQLIKSKDTHYQSRNFAVKVLSQSGPAVSGATIEFVEAMREEYCPVPGAFFRVLRGLGKDAALILNAGYRHPDPFIRERSVFALRYIGRTEPTIQKLFENLQSEGPLLQRLSEASVAERVGAITALADQARTTPGTATNLVKALNKVTDKTVIAHAETRLIELGRESPETVVALLAAVRSDDEYRARNIAVKVLPKVGANLNCPETIAAMADDNCPVPHSMHRIFLAAGHDALPVLRIAENHSNRDVRDMAKEMLRRIPNPVTGAVSK